MDSKYLRNFWFILIIFRALEFDYVTGFEDSFPICRRTWRLTRDRSSPGGRYDPRPLTLSNCITLCRSDRQCIGFEFDVKIPNHSKCWLHYQGHSLIELFDVEDFGVNQYYKDDRCSGARTTGIIPLDVLKKLTTRIPESVTPDRTACQARWRNHTYSHSVGASLFPEFVTPAGCLGACQWSVANCAAAELEIQPDLSILCWLHTTSDDEEGVWSAPLLSHPKVHQFRIVEKCAPKRCVTRWRVYPNSNSVGGEGRPEALTVGKCQELCSKQMNCSAIDFSREQKGNIWIPTSRPTCFFHYGTGFEQSRQSGDSVRVHQYVVDKRCATEVTGVSKRIIYATSTRFRTFPPTLKPTEKHSTSSNQLRNNTTHSSIHTKGISSTTRNTRKPPQLTHKFSTQSFTTIGISGPRNDEGSQYVTTLSNGESGHGDMFERTPTEMEMTAGFYTDVESNTKEIKTVKLTELESLESRNNSTETPLIQTSLEGSNISKQHINKSQTITPLLLRSTKKLTTSEQEYTLSSDAIDRNSDETSSTNGMTNFDSRTKRPMSNSDETTDVPASSLFSVTESSPKSKLNSSDENLNENTSSKTTDFDKDASVLTTTEPPLTVVTSSDDTKGFTSTLPNNPSDQHNISKPLNASIGENNTTSARKMITTTARITKTSRPTMNDFITQHETDTVDSISGGLFSTSPVGNVSKSIELSTAGLNEGITSSVLDGRASSEAHTDTSMQENTFRMPNDMPDIGATDMYSTEKITENSSSEQNPLSHPSLIEPTASDEFLTSVQGSSLDLNVPIGSDNSSDLATAPVTDNVLSKSTKPETNDAESNTDYELTTEPRTILSSTTKVNQQFGVTNDKHNGSHEFLDSTGDQTLSGGSSSYVQGTRGTEEPTATPRSTDPVTSDTMMLNNTSRTSLVASSRILGVSNTTDYEVSGAQTVGPIGHTIGEYLTTQAPPASEVTWIVLQNISSLGAILDSTLDSIGDCLSECADQVDNCIGVDINHNMDKIQCWIHRSDTKFEDKYAQTGVDQYILQRFARREPRFCYPRYTVARSNLNWWPVGGLCIDFAPEIRCMMDCAAMTTCTGFHFGYDNDNQCSFWYNNSSKIVDNSSSSSSSSNNNINSAGSGIEFTKNESCSTICHVKWLIKNNTYSEGAIPVPEITELNPMSCLQFCSGNLDCVAVEISRTIPFCRYFNQSQKWNLRNTETDYATVQYTLLNRCSEKCELRWRPIKDIDILLIGSELHPEWTTSEECEAGCRQWSACRVYQLTAATDNITTCTIAKDFRPHRASFSTRVTTFLSEELNCYANDDGPMNCRFWWKTRIGTRFPNSTQNFNVSSVDECQNICLVLIPNCTAIDIRRQNIDFLDCSIHTGSKHPENAVQSVDHTQFLLLRKCSTYQDPMDSQFSHLSELQKMLSGGSHTP